jgi:alpha-ketoglutarate-dependent taurine dioxygenase
MRIADLEGSYVADPKETAHLITRDGAVHISDCGIAELQAFLRTWTAPHWHPHETAGGLTIIHPQLPSSEDLGRAAFTSRGLKLHTDRAIELDPPAILATLVLENSDLGGETLLLDGQLMSHTLLANRDVLSDLVLSDGASGSVRVFEVDGSVCRIRYRDDDVAHPAALTDNAAFVLRQLHQHMELPLRLRLQAREGYLIHNHRYLHGREAFAGHRVIARFLADVPPDSDFAYLNGGFKLLTE